MNSVIPSIALTRYYGKWFVPTCWDVRPESVSMITGNKKFIKFIREVCFDMPLIENPSF